MKELVKETVPSFKYNADLNAYKNKGYFADKFKQMNEILAETGMPEEYYRQQEQKRKRELSVIGIKGILSNADVKTNTFLLVVKGADNISELHYTITTMSSETLTQLVKAHWNDTVKVNVKPKELNGAEREYELIEVID
jgi:hypothetical protein